MKRLIFFILLACAGCSLENDIICEIEYIDGTKERIECIGAMVYEPMFGSPTVLEIHSAGGKNQVKSLSTIKCWHQIKKSKSE